MTILSKQREESSYLLIAFLNSLARQVFYLLEGLCLAIVLRLLHYSNLMCCQQIHHPWHRSELRSNVNDAAELCFHSFSIK